MSSLSLYDFEFEEVFTIHDNTDPFCIRKVQKKNKNTIWICIWLGIGIFLI